MFGKYSKGNGNLQMAFMEESDIPKFAILKVTLSACESALQWLQGKTENRYPGNFILQYFRRCADFLDVGGKRNGKRLVESRDMFWVRIDVLNIVVCES